VGSLSVDERAREIAEREGTTMTTSITDSNMGRDLNVKWRVYDEIFTPDELTDAGFVVAPAPSFVTDRNGEIHEFGTVHVSDDEHTVVTCRTRKLRARYCHDWSDEDKKLAKQAIVDEMREQELAFIYSVYLTDFAESYDYTDVCWDIRVMVRGSKRKAQL
jgi:hypothetical protein